MKLNVFSAETLPNNKGAGAASKARISFAPKGKIAFSKVAVDQLKLKPIDNISLAQDDANPEHWYFYKDKAGFSLRPINKGGLLFCHQELVKTFIEAWDLDATKTHKVVLDPEPVTIKGDKANVQYWRIQPV